MIGKKFAKRGVTVEVGVVVVASATVIVSNSVTLLVWNSVVSCRTVSVITSVSWAKVVVSVSVANAVMVSVAAGGVTVVSGVFVTTLNQGKGMVKTWDAVFTGDTALVPYPVVHLTKDTVEAAATSNDRSRAVT